MTPTYSTTTRFGFRVPLINQKVNDFTAIIDALGSDIDAKVVGWASGLASARPAAGGRGRLYGATDTGVLAFDDGSKWRVIPTLAPARAYMTAYQSIVGTGWTILIPTGVSFDDEAALNASGAYVCPRAGKYAVSGAVEFSVGATSVFTAAGVWKNGSVYSQGTDLQIGGLTIGQYVGSAFSDIVSCAAGDQLQLAVYLLSSANGTVLATAGNSYFTVDPRC